MEEVANQAHRAPRLALHCLLVVFTLSSLHVRALCRCLSTAKRFGTRASWFTRTKTGASNSLRLALSLADFELIRRLGDGSFAQVCALGVQVWVSFLVGSYGRRTHYPSAPALTLRATRCAAGRGGFHSCGCGPPNLSCSAILQLVDCIPLCALYVAVLLGICYPYTLPALSVLH